MKRLFAVFAVLFLTAFVSLPLQAQTPAAVNSSMCPGGTMPGGALGFLAKDFQAACNDFGNHAAKANQTPALVTKYTSGAACMNGYVQAILSTASSANAGLSEDIEGGISLGAATVITLDEAAAAAAAAQANVDAAMSQQACDALAGSILRAGITAGNKVLNQVILKKLTGL